MTEQQQQPQTPQEYWKDFPEAPYSDTFKWIDSEGYEHMTTVRGWSGSGLLSAIGKMTEAIREVSGKPANQRPPVAPPPTTPQAQARTSPRR